MKNELIRLCALASLAVITCMPSITLAADTENTPLVIPPQDVITPQSSVSNNNATIAGPSNQTIPASTESNAMPNAEQAIVGNNDQQNVAPRSVVFKDEELQAVAEAVRQYEAKKAGGKKGDNNDLGSNIYLSSIIQNADSKWIAWVNGNKVKGQKINNNLSLINVSQSKAFFKWVIVDIDTSAPGWRSRANQISDNHYMINDHPIEVSIVNNNVGVVNFALQVNQTFIPQQLMVVEGKVYNGTLPKAG
ncbi:MAG: hypothetical protein JSS50_00120 [Proteobacteria bacterium]|nr:hypothetical protein [Pseudomonadota bacterium]